MLVVGGLGAAGLWLADARLGLVTGVVLLHFFLFCNVFRISRGKELVWAGVFFALAASTIVSSVPGWPIAIGGTLAVTVLVVALEMRSPTYHGVGWRRINPGLPEQ